MEVPTVEISRAKLAELQNDHEFLAQIKDLSEQVEHSKSDYQYAKDKSLEKKKTFDTLSSELHDLIQQGPPKPDPQGKLPFVAEEAAQEEVDEDEGPESDDEAVAEDPAASDSEEQQEVKVSKEIESLDLTARQKQLLADTGAKTKADLVDLGNGNWEQYPKGFADVKGLGPAAIAKLAAQLPSTAAGKDPEPGRLPAQTQRIKLLSFHAGNDNLQPGDEYDATVLDDGTAEIALPGQEPVSFQSYEYELVETQSANA